MSIPTSTAAAVKATLVAATVLQVNDQAVLVNYDAPGPNLPDDIIVFGEIRRAVATQSHVGSMGAGALNEKYTIDVKVSSFQGGDNAAAVEARAYVLLGAVETAMRTDPTVANNVVWAKPITSDSVTAWDDNHLGYLTTITAQLSFFAVL